MQAGQLIAQRYELERELGAGGMGVVWCARHIHTDKRVAVKCLHPNVAASTEVRQRFMREARVSARIDHPHIVDVLDAGELADGSLYLVMELLDGMPMSDAIRATPPLRLADFLIVVADVCRALAAAHAVGVVHRDIKPENIFLHQDRATGVSHGKILDFGISKLTEHADGVATTAGALLGSPRFMSPEQVMGTTALDGRTDLWAVGVMLFYALSGGWPHLGDNFTGLCIQISTQPPNSIDALAPNAPAALRDVVKGLLVPAAQRIADGNQLADVLEAIASDPVIRQHTVSPRLRDPSSNITSENLKVRSPSGKFVSPTFPEGAAAQQLAGYPVAAQPYPHPQYPTPQPATEQAAYPHAAAYPPDAGAEATVLGGPAPNHANADGAMANGHSTLSGSPVAGPAHARGNSGAWIGALAALLVAAGAGIGVWIWSEGRSAAASGESAAPIATSSGPQQDGTEPSSTAPQASATSEPSAAPNPSAAADASATADPSAIPSANAGQPANSSSPVATRPPRPGRVPPAPSPTPTPTPRKPGVVGEDLGSGL